MIRTILSPPMMTATLLVAVVLGVAGGFSLWRLGRPVDLLTAARRALQTARVEGYITRGSMVVLVVSALVILLFLL